MRKLILISFLLAFCVVIFPNVSHTLGFEGFGGKVGLILPVGGVYNNTIVFGVVAYLGNIMPSLNALKAETSFEYWRVSYSGIFLYSIPRFNIDAKYYFSNSGIAPFAGGGFEYYRISPYYNADFNLVGGVDAPIGTNMKFVAEATYGTGVDWFQITGGIVVKLK